MDPETAWLVSEAERIDDEGRARCEALERQLEQRHRHLDLGHPDNLDGHSHRDPRGGDQQLIYKTKDDALVVPQQPAVTREQVLELIGALADEAGSAAGKLEKQINELRERMLKLEVANEILRSFITTKVATLTAIKGKASDAA